MVTLVSHFQPKNSQNVALLTEIVSFFEKKIWGAFWRFLGQKWALPDSKHLATLKLSLFFCFGQEQTSLIYFQSC